MTNKLIINTCRGNDITQCWSSAGFNIALKREGAKRDKKRKRSYYNTGYTYLVTHPSTNPTEQGLTLLSWQDVALPVRCIECNFFCAKRKKGNKERNKNRWYWLGKLRTKKNERDENENYYLLWWSDKMRYFLYRKHLQKVKVQHFSAWQLRDRVLTFTDNEFSSTFISIVLA